MGLISVDSIFLTIGLVSTLFFALGYRRMIDYPHTDEYYKKRKIGAPPEITLRAKIHGFWINIIGYILGWFLIYILYRDLFSNNLRVNINDIDLNHFLIFIIGTLGIMGFFPMTIWGIASSMRYFTDKIIDRIK